MSRTVSDFVLARPQALAFDVASGSVSGRDPEQVCAQLLGLPE